MYILCFSSEAKARSALTHYREEDPKYRRCVAETVYIEDLLLKANSKYGAIFDMPSPMPLGSFELDAISLAQDGDPAMM